MATSSNNEHLNDAGLEMTKTSTQDGNVQTENDNDDSVVEIVGENTCLLLQLSDAPRDYREANSSFRNFVTMSILFSAVPAAAIACLSLATARLGSIGAWQSGILYLTYTLSAISGATYVVKRLGSKQAMVLGMVLYCAYVACFLVAIIFSQKAKPLALTGAAIGGVGAGFLWTSQGVYLTQASEEYSLLSGKDWSKSTSKLAAVFAFVLLVEETTLDLLSTVLIRAFGIPWSIIFCLYSLIAITATVAMSCCIKEYPKEDDAVNLTEVFHKVTAAFHLLVQDSKMKYMIGLNAAFGFSGAFLNSFISGEVVPVGLQDSQSSYIGLLVAIHGGVAALSSLLFGSLSNKVGKGPVLICGALAFSSVAFPFLIQPDLQQWTWGLLILVYSAQGLGRATFEGTLKAIFADYFAYEKEGAFANIILQNGISSAVAYVLSFRLTCSHPDKYCIEYRDKTLHDLFAFAMLVVLVSISAIAGYLRAAWLFRYGSKQELSIYRTRSIASYRSSRASDNILDRRTYQALETAIAQQEESTSKDLPAVT